MLGLPDDGTCACPMTARALKTAATAQRGTCPRAGPGGAVYSYTAPQANGDGPATGGGGPLDADDFSEATANGTYQSMATGVRFQPVVMPAAVREGHRLANSVLVVTSWALTA